MDDQKFVRFLYTGAFGRLLLKLLLKGGLFRLAERFLSTKYSKPLINAYIRKHKIDMSLFDGQSYETFQQFFARKRTNGKISSPSDALISPCDGLLSAFPIHENSAFSMKGSSYRIQDLVDDNELASLFQSGICLIFRLQATDYHHFCYIDDGFQYTNHLIPGMLHSVQPIACESVPVYRLNRRLWTLMDTKNFGKIIQIGVGALLVGEIVHKNSCCSFTRGEEMGHFELAGSTIVLLFEKDRIHLNEKIKNAIAQGKEVPVHMGEVIGASNQNSRNENEDTALPQ